ncbi:hypothetical protein [Antrihabitans sp. YC2-6]|uniref:hypothetical protein n=1 Tax=Antrihabitans sp. YC2-6 TaxID=2799498 RepID=UPI0018F57D1A|nr:hypothetical protein [Antrihabitans sp. YC2-6]MBJ8345091.1 hypothetical protein [Antrihabitans sp. YC2-6]
MRATTEAIAAITEARTPEDLFGVGAGTSDAVRAAKRAFHRLAFLVHPDRVAHGEKVAAAVAFTRVAELYERWQVRSDGGVRFVGAHGEYALGALHARGAVANVYRSGSATVVKIPRKPNANMLIANERAALADLAALAADHTWLAPYFPRLVDRATHVDSASGQTREVDVLAAMVDGFVPLSAIARAYPDGLDQPDYAWMHRRLLRAVAGAHATGWVHGAIFAENVLIHPELHGVVLVGWSFATRPGGALAATVRSGTYPPEVRAGLAVSPETDVYMVNALMLAMLGDRAPDPIRAFAIGCMQDNPRLRPTAADLLEEYDDLLDRTYGKRRFRPFAMPAHLPDLQPTMKGK